MRRLLVAMGVSAVKIRDLDLSASSVNLEHEALGIPPIERAVAHSHDHPVLRRVTWFVAIALLTITAYFLSRLFAVGSADVVWNLVVDTVTSREFVAAAMVGLLAQTIDGALGMAYGLTATTFLMGTGVPPAVATASVHIAEVFTTGLSGVSHIRMGNVNKDLFLRLLIPGVVGAVAGAVLVTQIDGAVLKPYISAYLVIMGIYILSKAWRHVSRTHREPRHVGKLALFGGFVDTVGGGGWGPVVTTSLVGAGRDPRTTIGSVNLAEFFLALSSAASFAVLMGESTWPAVGGLVFGGLFAAPLAAVLTRRLNTRVLLILVGSLITLLSLYNLYRALG